MSPQVSVVVPTRNRSRLLKLTLRSILWQEDVALEVIVVDDGSDDDTTEAVKGLADPRVRLVRHAESQGVSAARNRGIAEATGAWVAFCDDDDLWAPNKLARQLAAADQQGGSWVCVGAVNIGTALQVVGGGKPLDRHEIHERLPEINVVAGGCSGVMVRRETLTEVGGFDPSLSPMADWDLWLRLARFGPPALAAEPLVAYRVHAANMSLDTERMEREFAVLERRSQHASAALFYRYLGWWCLRVGRRRAALRYFLRAAAQRDARVPLRSSAFDLGYFARSVLRDFLRRAPGQRRLVERRPRPDPESAVWRAQAEDWLASLRPER